MAHDTDVDIAVHAGWGELIPDIVTLFEDAGLALCMMHVAEEVPSQLVFVHRGNGTIVDIEVYYTGLIDGARVHLKPEGYIALPSWLVRSWLPRRIAGVMAPLPDRIEGYLEARYGRGWQMPVGVDAHWHDYTAAFVKW